MDKELKAKWLARLRDPEMKQTRATLKDESGYCCIGVLCSVVAEDHELAHKLGMKMEVTPNYIRVQNPVDLEEWLSGVLPTRCVRALGWDWDTQKELTTRNDNGFSFSEIADYIEENL